LFSVKDTLPYSFVEVSGRVTGFSFPSVSSITAK
jgi:hypothetical protein